jgi:hypothetical protein
MRQTLHIFRKDARHFWPYAAVVLGLTAVLAYLDLQTTYIYPWRVFLTADMIRLLVLPLAWCFTIAAVVHDEAPAGDRQFWLTRPYSWKSVAAAKALFVLLLLIVPYFLADCIVLSAKGFPLSGLAPGLLWRECWIAAFLMLPPFLLAALTRGMREFALGLLMLALALAGIVQILEIATNNPMFLDTALAVYPGVPWSVLGWVPWLGPVALLVLLGWHYACRRTPTVRAIAAALAALWLLSVPAANTLALKAPSSTGFPEVSVVFAPDRGRFVPNPAEAGRSDLQVDVPVDVAGRDPELLGCQLESIEITPLHGAPWHAGSNSNSSAYEVWHGGKDWIEMRFAGPLLRRLAAGPVTLRAVLAVTVFEQHTVRFAHSRSWHPIPGFGVVRVQSFGSDAPVLLRRVPLGDPAANWSYSVEQPGKGILRQEEIFGWSGPSWQMSPVTDFALYGSPGSPLLPTPLPPGAQIVLTAKQPVASLRRELTIASLRLSDYTVAKPTP